MTAKTEMAIVYTGPNVGGCDECLARDEMTAEDFNAMMAEGLAQAKAGKGIPLKEAFHTLRECL